MIGVFGGSGFYRWLEGAERLRVETPYGAPSGEIAIGAIKGKRVAFMARHDERHQIPAHMVNYRANLWAMHEAGVRRILAPCAVGSLRADVRPGDLVICDQFIDRTSGRADSYYEGPQVVHIAGADPYCPELRQLAGRAAAEERIRWHPKGTVVVIQGPRFSTRAESRWYSRMGWDLVGMTQYPEVILARELEMCYAGLALVTDYDAGLEGHEDLRPVEAQDVMRVLAENVARVQNLLARLIPMIPSSPSCACSTALARARL